MEEQAETVLFMEFIQYTFFEQWKKIKKICKQQRCEIIGDLPMYVARNSADIGANRHLFDLDRGRRAEERGGRAAGLFQRSSARSGATRFITG